VVAEALAIYTRGIVCWKIMALIQMENDNMTAVVRLLSSWIGSVQYYPQILNSSEPDKQLTETSMNVSFNELHNYIMTSSTTLCHCITADQPLLPSPTCGVVVSMWIYFKDKSGSTVTKSLFHQKSSYPRVDDNQCTNIQN